MPLLNSATYRLSSNRLGILTALAHSTVCRTPADVAYELRESTGWGETREFRVLRDWGFVERVPAPGKPNKRRGQALSYYVITDAGREARDQYFCAMFPERVPVQRAEPSIVVNVESGPGAPPSGGPFPPLADGYKRAILRGEFDKARYCK